jgi:hypothetical protein
MPRKVFTAGEVLAAADVNEFLMDQSVMTFASSAARGSAIGTATEGMVTWLNDENALQVYDGTAWNGLAASGGNAIINGAFEINQRNFTSSTVAGVYGFDRWFFNQSGATGTYSSESFTPGTAPVAGYEASNFARMEITTGNDFASIAQRIEDVRTYANQTVTVSFFAKGTNPITEDGLNVILAQLFGSGGSAAVNTISDKFTLTNEWQRFSIPLNVPSISGKTIGAGSSLTILIGQGASVSTDAWTLDIWGVQVEAGPTANVFRRNANSLAGELAACQRYYYRLVADTAYSTFGLGYAKTTNTGNFMIPFPVQMRAAATSLDYSNLTAFDGANLPAITSASLIYQNRNTGSIEFTVGAGLLTQFRPYSLLSNNSTAAFIGFSAEL